MMKVVKGADLMVHSEMSARVRVYLTPAEGTGGLSLTVVELEAGSTTGEHSHDSDQFVYILEGEVQFSGEGEEHRLGAGDLIQIPMGCRHQHRNVGSGVLRQLSLFVPPR